MRLLTLFVILTVGACTSRAPETEAAKETTPVVQPTAQPAHEIQATAGSNEATDSVEAQKVFEQRCVLCHGQSGKGDGVASANLNPKPRDYTNTAWQASVTDDYLRKIIVGGGDSVGKSMMMPANPDLKDKPQVVNGLVKIVRGFGQK
jgi:mono/diheme cytochrome c family protein